MAVPDPGIPRLIGDRYALEACIGRGGMGEVWRARHVALGSYFAVKLLHGALASEERTRKRFLKEAQLTAQLRTRRAVQVFDYGVTQDGIPYLVMELLDGETLDQRIARLGRIEPAPAVRILRLAARALDRAHQIGIIHRDFKPENIFLLEDEEGVETVKVVDFGIAKLVGELETDNVVLGSLPEGKEALSTFTRTATLVGTPYYMGPEQISSTGNLGPSTDLWALGVVAFECLTGQRPFDAEELRDLFKTIENSSHPRASELVPELPAAFDAWFDKACHAELGERFKNGQQAIVELAAALGVPLARDGSGVRGSLASLQGTSERPGEPTPVPSVTPPQGIGSGVFTPSGHAVPSQTTGSIAPLGPKLAWLRSRPQLIWWLVGVVAALAVALVGLLGMHAASRAQADRTLAPSAATASPRLAEPELASPMTETALAIPERSARRSQADDEPRSAPRALDTKRSKGAASATSASPAPSAQPPAPSQPAATAADPGSAFKLPPLGL
jgi:serine/threonine-protein kinase